MNKQAELLITLRDNCNVVIQALLENKDLTGETLPEINSFKMDLLMDAEEITRQLMYDVSPTHNPEVA